MRSVPIPGEVLRTTVFLGLTFDELVLLGSIPLVVMLPGVAIRSIPLLVPVAIGGLATLGVVIVALRTPDGQTPVEWAPAAARRRLTPDTYHLKPRERGRDHATTLDVWQTRAHLDRASEASTDGPASDVADGSGGDR